MPPIQHEAPTMIAERTQGGELVEVTLPMEEGALPDPTSRLQRGDVLGRYVVLDVLGHGGMGVVYAAYDPELDRKIALKLVKCETGSGGPTGRSRLLREAQALARLSHPNIVAVYDVGTWEDSVFVAMEFVEGETIARWIERHHAEGPPPWKDVLSVMLPAGRGLSQAHAAGIVHRDFKPENVMRSHSGRVLVLDFGLARATEGSADSLTESMSTSLRSGSMMARLTATGSVMGTPAYMSPEQFGAGVSDEASDQFSYCVSLYHALYGSRPFLGETLIELTDAVLSGRIEPAPRGSAVPAWLRRVLLRGLAMAPSERYPSMTELLAALEHDPGRRLRWIGLGAGAAALAGAAWLTADHLASAEDPCAPVEQAMRQAWGPPQRQALEQAFRHDARIYSEASIERVEQALDGYASEWGRARRAACEAGRRVGTDAGRAAALRAACLDQRLRRFDALVRLLGDADQSVVAQAISAVQQLPSAAQCERAPGQVAAIPDEPERQEAVESLRLRLAQTQALAMIGRLQPAEGRALALLTEARAIDFDPLVAEVLLLVGGVQAQLGKFADSLAALEEGLLLARAHGLERLEADLLSPLVFLHTSYTANFDLADWQARVRQVLVDRVDPRPGAQARVLLDRGRLEHRRGRVDAAIELLERSVQLHRQGGRDGVNLVLAQEHLASAYMEAGRYDEAASVLERAEEVAAAALGPEHPSRGNLLVHSSRVEDSRGDHARAAEQLRAALSIYEGAYGSSHPNISAVLNGLGLQLEALGQPQEAVVQFRRGQALILAAFGDQHAPLGIIEANLGNTLRRLGQAAEALELHRSVERLRERLEVADEQRYELLDNLGDDLRVLGRYEEAIARYQAANAIRESGTDQDRQGTSYALAGIGLCQWHAEGPQAALPTLELALRRAEQEVDGAVGSKQVLALVRFSLALVLRDAERGAARAERLAEQARAYWMEDPVQHRVRLHELEQWLAGARIEMPTY
ncbi:MAG: serine/threonine-protein kinase [Myxococcota bacterium]